jgi:hypothetical protein
VQICARCGRGSGRHLIGGRRCINCANRASELAKGCNGRGLAADPREPGAQAVRFSDGRRQDVLRPVRAKAMLVILTDEECDAWLEADVETALKLQRPLPAKRLAVVANGEHPDTAGLSAPAFTGNR